jgi:hypothetical protein
MRIPTNSTFSKEIAKQFKRIFNRDMTLGGLQDLQEQIDLINPVDTHLVNQVSQLRKADEPKKNVSGMQEQLDKSTHKEKVLLEKLFKLKQKKKELAFKLHHLKYHQPIL